MQEETTRSSGPVLYVDRAYLDYYITPEWIATMEDSQEPMAQEVILETMF